jgi:hypothetical protein
MADIQLNKPLYKSGGGEAGAQRVEVPKPGRPSLLPRMGAILMDVLLLHFFYMLLLKAVPAPAIALGRAGEWIGLLVAWVYFSLCGSHLFLGRTLGKLFMRLQVGEAAAPDLPLGRSAVRAALLLAGCAVTIALNQLATVREQANPQDPQPIFLATLGWAINAGWLLGNLLFSAYEPFGRTLYDRLTGALVTASDADPALLQEHLANVRSAFGQPIPRRCYVALAICLLGACAVITPQYMRLRSEMAKLTPEEKERVQRGQALFRVQGFGRPGLTGRFENLAGQEDKTSTHAAVLAAILAFDHVGRFDTQQLKDDPTVTSFHERVVRETEEQPDFRATFGETMRGLYANLNLDRTRSEAPGTTVPKLLRLEMSFREKGDLFFAWDSMPKYSVSELLDMDAGDPNSSRPITIKLRR